MENKDFKKAFISRVNQFSEALVIKENGVKDLKQEFSHVEFKTFYSVLIRSAATIASEYSNFAMQANELGFDTIMPIETNLVILEGDNYIPNEAFIQDLVNLKYGVYPLIEFTKFQATIDLTRISLQNILNRK